MGPVKPAFVLELFYFIDSGPIEVDFCYIIQNVICKIRSTHLQRFFHSRSPSCLYCEQNSAVGHLAACICYLVVQFHTEIQTIRPTVKFQLKSIIHTGHSGSKYEIPALLLWSRFVQNTRSRGSIVTVERNGVLTNAKLQQIYLCKSTHCRSLTGWQSGELASAPVITTTITTRGLLMTACELWMRSGHVSLGTPYILCRPTPWRDCRRQSRRLFTLSPFPYTPQRRRALRRDLAGLVLACW